jgi:hypothetical protein
LQRQPQELQISPSPFSAHLHHGQIQEEHANEGLIKFYLEKIHISRIVDPPKMEKIKTQSSL